MLEHAGKMSRAITAFIESPSIQPTEREIEGMVAK